MEYVLDTTKKEAGRANFCVEHVIDVLLLMGVIEMKLADFIIDVDLFIWEKMNDNNLIDYVIRDGQIDYESVFIGKLVRIQPGLDIRPPGDDREKTTHKTLIHCQGKTGILLTRESE